MLNATLSSLLGQPVVSATPIGRGRNSKVLCVLCANGQRCAAKLYHGRRADGLSRLAVEFQSLQLLWDHGFRCVPQPMAAAPEKDIAVYEYIDGAEIDGRTVSEDEIDELLVFLGRLKNLAGTVGRERVAVAYEACFSANALVANIHTKLSRLTGLREDSPPCRALQAFLQREFIPVLRDGTEAIRTALGEDSFGAELPQARRTLSPADFGFHNALRRLGTGLVFLDFEYFGWETPVKMMCDFLLHPAMSLRREVKEYFAGRFLECFRDDADLPARFKTVYPLYGLRWCMILLNEFLPDHLERRTHASSRCDDVTQWQMQQLAKSRHMLRKVLEERDCGVCAA